MIKNLLDLQTTTVSKDIKDYDMLIIGESGIGKSELALEIYGKEKTLALAFEDSYAGISGAYAVNIDSYATLVAYVSQLENPEVRKKYDTIIIDTLFLLDFCIEKSITDAYGVDIIKDALKWNAGFKIVDKKFLSIIKKIQKLGYTICYIAHPTTKKVKIDGKELDRLEPKVSNRIKDLLLPEIDIRVFCFTDAEGNRKIATQQTTFYDARCRVAEMKPLIDFDAEAFREEFAKGIELKQSKGGAIIDKKVVETREEKSFEELMTYLTKDLSSKCKDLGLLEEATHIINSELGRDDEGRQRGLNCLNSNMKNVLETIIVEVEILINKKGN